jgi:hypothetical protein
MVCYAREVVAISNRRLLANGRCEPIKSRLYGRLCVRFRS